MCCCAHCLFFGVFCRRSGAEIPFEMKTTRSDQTGEVLPYADHFYSDVVAIDRSSRNWCFKNVYQSSPYSAEIRDMHTRVE